MQTDLQKRKDEIDAIVRICGLAGDEHRVIRAQLDSFSNLAIEVTHRLVTRADNGMSRYWRERAESAESYITGETQYRTS